MYSISMLAIEWSTGLYCLLVTAFNGELERTLLNLDIS